AGAALRRAKASTLTSARGVAVVSRIGIAVISAQQAPWLFRCPILVDPRLEARPQQYWRSPLRQSRHFNYAFKNLDRGFVLLIDLNRKARAANRDHGCRRSHTERRRISQPSLDLGKNFSDEQFQIVASPLDRRLQHHVAIALDQNLRVVLQTEQNAAALHRLNNTVRREYRAYIQRQRISLRRS